MLVFEDSLELPERHFGVDALINNFESLRDSMRLTIYICTLNQHLTHILHLYCRRRLIQMACSVGA